MISTVGEASAVNTLLRYVMAYTDSYIGPVPDNETARDAAAQLADSASTKLMAGLNGDLVRKHWRDLSDLDEVAADVHAVFGKWDPETKDWVVSCHYRECGELGHAAGVREVGQLAAQHEGAAQVFEQLRGAVVRPVTVVNLGDGAL